MEGHMADNAPTGVTVTPKFRMLFPNLFEARAVQRNGKDTGEAKYSLAMLFDASEQADGIKQMKHLAAKVAKERWPNRDLGELTFPFKDGAKEKQKAESKNKNGDFYEGMVVLKAASKFQPGVVGPNKQEIMDTKQIYSGCYGYAEINFVAYDGVGANPDGVTAYLNFVMKAKDGDKLVGRSAADAFAGIEGSVSSEDPTAGQEDLDDEIPF
jgi:hypothetical protein